MTLQALFATHTWAEIEPRFRELYPEGSIEGHAVAFEEIRFVVPKQDNEPLQIRVKEVQPDPKYHEEGGWFNVSGSKVDGDVAGYAIEFSPWSWWLAQELHEDTLLLPPIDVICHCLHEMTFCGYSQEEVAVKSADILGTADAALDEFKKMENGEIPEGWTELTDEDLRQKDGDA
jgi:hypothetical protein